jgi:excisionase family DNA binding protein
VSTFTAITPAPRLPSAEKTPLLLAIEEASLHAIAERVAALLEERRDDGFLDIDGAAAFLGGSTKKRIYHLVERGRIRAHKVGGRLLFDPTELREDVERSE